MSGVQLSDKILNQSRHFERRHFAKLVVVDWENTCAFILVNREPIMWWIWLKQSGKKKCKSHYGIYYKGEGKEAMG